MRRGARPIAFKFAGVAERRAAPATSTTGASRRWCWGSAVEHEKEARPACTSRASCCGCRLRALTGSQLKDPNSMSAMLPIVRVQGGESLASQITAGRDRQVRRAFSRRDLTLLEVTSIEQNKILTMAPLAWLPGGHELGHALLALRRVFVHGRHFSLGFRNAAIRTPAALEHGHDAPRIARRRRAAPAVAASEPFDGVKDYFVMWRISTSL